LPQGIALLGEDCLSVLDNHSWMRPVFYIFRR
jgi:hypothetical protein